MEISIDNQYFTKSLQRYRFLPKQPKENTEKITNLMIFFDSDCLLQVCLSYICFSLVPCCMDVPMLVFAAWLVQDLMRMNSRTCSRTYCGCFRTSLRTFYDFLRTFLRTKYILLRTIIASIYECDFREENHMVVGHFKRYFKYTLYIIIGMNNVMSSSKDWPFNQILAYL